MSTARFRVGFAGPHVSIQDGGRRGYMRFGVPASGPMDRTGFACANLALGQDADQTGIEVSMGGLVLSCVSGAITLAVAGGGFRSSIGAAGTEAWSVRTIRAGETLGLRAGAWGSWCYLAFAGTLRSRRWLNHAATHASSGLGGGRVETGADLHVDDARVLEAREGDIPCPDFARPSGPVRVVLGPQDHHFDPSACRTFLSEPYHLSEAYDRMGVRLSGPTLPLGDALAIPSEPILRGSVQVSGDGVPTILLADHQTTGGYPKIATVLGCDIDRLSQCRAGDRLRFTAVTPAEAIEITRA